MTAKRKCCCGITDCDEWNACLPEQITFPSIVIRRRYRVFHDASTQIDVTMTLEFNDLVFEDLGLGRLDCTGGTLDARFRSTQYAYASGVHSTPCPPCLDRKICSDFQVEHLAQSMSGQMRIYCDDPCPGNPDTPLVLMRGEIATYGPIFDPGGPANYGLGCAANAVDIDDFFFIGLDVWAPLQCVGTGTFKCRSVDSARYDGTPFFYNGFGWGRIPGSTGGNPLDAICSGAYAHERPWCDESNVAQLDCIDTAWGVEATHYDVTSCVLDDVNATGGLALAVDTHDCENPPGTVTLNCDPMTSGLLGSIYRRDELYSTFAQPTIP